MGRNKKNVDKNNLIRFWDWALENITDPKVFFWIWVLGQSK